MGVHVYLAGAVTLYEYNYEIKNELLYCHSFNFVVTGVFNLRSHKENGTCNFFFLYMTSVAVTDP